MKSYLVARYAALGLIYGAMMVAPVTDVARSEVASIYGGRDRLCGHRTANGERFNCLAMTAAHRTLPFGTRVRDLSQRMRNGANKRSWPVGPRKSTLIYHRQRLGRLGYPRLAELPWPSDTQASIWGHANGWELK